MPPVTGVALLTMKKEVMRMTEMYRFRMLQGTHGITDDNGVMQVYRAKAETGKYPVFDTDKPLHKSFPDRFELAPGAHLTAADQKVDTGTQTLAGGDAGMSADIEITEEVPKAPAPRRRRKGTPPPPAKEEVPPPPSVVAGEIEWRPVMASRGCWFVTKFADGEDTGEIDNEEALLKSEAMTRCDALNE